MPEETSLGGPRAAFQETLWSSVLRARNDEGALGRLIERTWKPLYYFARRKGRDVEAAKDVVQAFFAHLIEGRLLDQVREGRGRFRSFLLAAFDHYLANVWRVERAEKRGGGRAPLSLNFADAESRYAPALAGTPEDLYTRAWAMELVSGAFDALRAELGERFEAVRAQLSPEGPRPSYRETAEALGISESDVSNLLHKTRRRLGELLVERARDTVDGDPGEEVAELLRALGGKR